MRVLFLLSFAANMVLSVVSMFVLPAKVAIHFAVGGMPDNWAPRHVHVLLFTGLELLLFVVTNYVPRIIMKLPARWINMPNKDYWLDETRRPEAAALMGSLFWQFGTVLFSFMLVVGVLAVQANLSNPVKLNERVFLTALVLFLLYAACWVVQLILAFRIPGGSRRAGR